MQVCEAIVRMEVPLSENPHATLRRLAETCWKTEGNFTLKLEPLLLLFLKIYGSECVFVKLTVCMDFGSISGTLFGAVALNSVRWKPNTISPFWYKTNHLGEFITSWRVHTLFRNTQPWCTRLCFSTRYRGTVWYCHRFVNLKRDNSHDKSIPIFFIITNFISSGRPTTAWCKWCNMTQWANIILFWFY